MCRSESSRLGTAGEVYNNRAHAPAGGGLSSSVGNRAQAVKLVPHPQPPVAFGLLKVNPDPCIEVT